jgi:hypothetical protein
MQSRGRPADVPSPAVPDDDRVALAERLDHSRDVAGEGERVVPAWGLVRPAVPAQVHRRGTKAGLGEERQLVAPRPPELREPVQQQHQRGVGPILGKSLRNVEPGPIGGDVAVLPGARDVDHAIARMRHHRRLIV